MDNQQEISEAQLAYLGGLIDGEGCVTLLVQNRQSKTPGGKPLVQAVPNISFANTEDALVSEYKQILDSLGVAYYVAHRPAHGRNSESWQVFTKGIKRAVKLLPYLTQWCRGKKKANSVDLLEFCETRLADWHGAPYTERQIELAQRIKMRNYGRLKEPILRDYTRSSRSSKYPNG